VIFSAHTQTEHAELLHRGKLFRQAAEWQSEKSVSLVKCFTDSKIISLALKYRY